MTTLRCPECERVGEHEMSCAFAPDLDRTPLPERAWIAVTDRGRRLRFTLAPSADASKALRYALTHPAEFGLAASPERILSVEEEG